MKAIVILLFIVLLPVVSTAQDVDVRVIMLDEKPFVAFTEKDAEALLKIRFEYPKLVKLNLKYKEQLTNKTKQISILEDGASLLNKQVVGLSKENHRLHQEITGLTKWYNNIYFWMFVGTVVGTAATISIVYAVSPKNASI